MRDPYPHGVGSVTFPIHMGLMEEIAEREGGFTMKSCHHEQFRVRNDGDRQ